VERFIEASDGGLHAENDPRRIADRLEELLEDERLRRRAAESGREHVDPAYDRGTIARRFSEELARLVEADRTTTPSRR
jgi:glycosyltransferase involved in cell wall biosynthesis